jgi:CheY-like chemotaxis protein
MRRLLLVDDNSNLIKSLMLALGTEFEVDACADGALALDLLREATRTMRPYDLLISDLLMPNVDGLKLLEASKRLYPKLPVVLMTAFGRPHVLRKAVKLHCDGFLDKPFTPAEILELVEDTLRHVELRDTPFSGNEVFRTKAPSGATGRRLGKYEILEEIGAGGMGVIYKALQVDVDRIVALKTLLPEAREDPEAVWRFRREAAAMAHLNHPNIAVVHEIGSQHGIDYIAMEYVSGARVTCLLGSLCPDDAFRLIAHIAHALAYAHESGVLHHDIKPGNLLVDEDGRAVLVDFGIAIPATRSEDDGYCYGTLEFMAPEYLEGHPYDATCEVYALGVVLYQLLVGRGRFPYWDANDWVKNPDAVLRQVACGAKSIQEYCPGLDPGRVRAVDRAVAPRGERFRTMNEFLDALGVDMPRTSLVNGAASLFPTVKIARPVEGSRP